VLGIESNEEEGGREIMMDEKCGINEVLKLG
jgi:hypothetical protein